MGWSPLEKPARALFRPARTPAADPEIERELKAFEEIFELAARPRIGEIVVINLAATLVTVLLIPLFADHGVRTGKCRSETEARRTGRLGFQAGPLALSAIMLGRGLFILAARAAMGEPLPARFWAYGPIEVPAQLVLVASLPLLYFETPREKSYLGFVWSRRAVAAAGLAMLVLAAAIGGR